MKRTILLCGVLALFGCTTNDLFSPKSQYPPDPWVKGYSNPDDCLGGEKLAAREFALPDYPKRAFNSGRQGWVIVKLDVSAEGETENIEIERALPSGLFGGHTKSAIDDWRFEPPKDGALTNCRVLIRYRMGSVSLGS